MPVTQIWEFMMQILYPPHCLFCDALLAPGETCGDCRDQTATLKLTGNERAEHPGAAWNHFDGITSSFIYTGAAAEAVIRYKFHEKSDLFREMAKYMAQDIADMLGALKIDVVTCVPSFKTGNLHSKLLAGGVARNLGKKFDAALLKKIRATQKQHDLKFEERADNIKDAFAPNRLDKIKGQGVLVCDDVFTSGHTLNECAAALRKAGAKTVYGCTFAAARTGISGQKLGMEKEKGK